jgi:hypothetical protein
LLVRGCIFAACVFGLALGGCYNPRVKSGGFACTSSAANACPNGFYCVDGLCQDTPGNGGNGGVGGNGAGDMSSTGDLATTSHGADMATKHVDMATATQDMTPIPDMTMCTKSNKACNVDSDCCSGSCVDYFLFSACQ